MDETSDYSSWMATVAISIYAGSISVETIVY
jgi:hypothetical protein